jgi:DNA-binding response OmpR family regulator
MQKKVLVLEDEESIRAFVVINLKRSGYTAVECGTGQEALDYLRENSDISIALLDVMLPDMSGFDVCRRIRGMGSKMGVIMLTAMSQESDRVTGLMTGADDYVTKPFSVAELVARVDALYRRLGGSDFDSETLTSGEFRLNLRSRELSRGGQRIELTQVEFMIMKVFLENPGTAISREDLLHKVWGESYQGDLKVVDVNIRRLRLKVEPNAGQPRHILTVWGYGYKWEG